MSKLQKLIVHSAARLVRLITGAEYDIRYCSLVAHPYTRMQC